MKRAILVALGTGAVITSAAAISIGAAVGPSPDGMTREGYEAGLRRLQALQEGARARCDSLDAPDASICHAQLRADHRIRSADLENAFRRTERAARDALRARIDARYEVDRARCEPLRGLRKDKCLIAVHAAKGRALLESAAPYEVRAGI
jgi:hypothetical protein